MKVYALIANDYESQEIVAITTTVEQAKEIAKSKCDRGEPKWEEDEFWLLWAPAHDPFWIRDESQEVFHVAEEHHLWINGFGIEEHELVGDIRISICPKCSMVCIGEAVDIPHKPLCPLHDGQSTAEWQAARMMA